MKLQEGVYLAYLKHIEAKMEANRLGALAARDDLERSPLWWNGVLDKTVHIPKVFDAETMEQFRQIVTISCGIFGKVIRAYRENADYRKLFPFSKELEELILLPAPYDGVLPIARLDLFYHEDTGAFQFCEIKAERFQSKLWRQAQW